MAIEKILSQLHSIGAGAGRLGRLLRDLGRGQTDVGAAAIQGKAVVVALRLPVRMVNVNHHRDLLLEGKKHEEKTVHQKMALGDETAPNASV